MLYILWRFKLAEELMTSLFSQGLLWSIQLQWYTQERKRWIDLSIHTHTHTHTLSLSLSLSLSSLSCFPMSDCNTKANTERAKQKKVHTIRKGCGWLTFCPPPSCSAPWRRNTQSSMVSKLSPPAYALCSAPRLPSPLPRRVGNYSDAHTKGERVEVGSRGRLRGENSVNTEKKALHAIGWPRGHEEIWPTGRHAKWPWEKEWHLFSFKFEGIFNTF